MSAIALAVLKSAVSQGQPVGQRENAFEVFGYDFFLDESYCL